MKFLDGKLFAVLGIVLFILNFAFTFVATYWWINLVAAILLGINLPNYVRTLAEE